MIRMLPDHLQGLWALGGGVKLGYFPLACRGGGMADAADLKSVVRKDVRVRLPPSAPITSMV